MKLLKVTLFLALMTAITSCSSLFQKRTFIDQMEHQTDGFWTPGEDFRMSAGDTGRSFRSRREIMQRTPKGFHDSKRSKNASSIMGELEKKLSRLSERDYINFTRYEDYLASPSEKIYMLSLPPQNWKEYISSRAAVKDNTRSGSFLTGRSPASIGASSWTPEENLYVGMDKNTVMEHWGRPHRIEEGQSIDEDSERWSFYSGGRIKHVFFEKDSVSSWSDE